MAKTTIEIARTGDFKDSGGTEQHFDESRLDRIIANSDLAAREAPLVIGHPRTDSPAYGWVTGLKRVGEKLLAEVDRVPEAIVRAVDNGHYRKVSMSLYKDDGLRHVGLLGGAAPAIDGLAPVSFSGEEAVAVEFADEENVDPKGKEMTNEELIKQFAEAQSKLDAATRERDAAAAEAAGLKTALAEAKVQAEKAAADFAAYQNDQAKKQISGRIEALINSGRLTPAERPDVEALAEHLRQSQAGAEFAAGQAGPLETYFKTLESREPSGLMTAFSCPPPEKDQAQPDPAAVIAKL